MRQTAGIVSGVCQRRQVSEENALMSDAIFANGAVLVEIVRDARGESFERGRNVSRVSPRQGDQPCNNVLADVDFVRRAAGLGDVASGEMVRARPEKVGGKLAELFADSVGVALELARIPKPGREDLVHASRIKGRGVGREVFGGERLGQAVFKAPKRVCQRPPSKLAQP